ncbi:MAG: tRNA (5-methylaminomethyl-2-thiouridine)(34)-methyltransferase MnmD, partial [Bacteroidales bacterium]|nr:tRNA (5-methylaminomethyl-2-thiouridine)(34)-methyltransferase MnmD [Bacteroidales bacterium]
QTADGSQTLYSDRVQEHYHSTFGALQESRHIFIQAGLLEAHRRKTSGLQAAGNNQTAATALTTEATQATRTTQVAGKTKSAEATQVAGTARSSNLPLKVFELGLGTGLNALLTMLEAGNLQLNLSYDCIEAYPLSPDLVQALNFPALFSEQDQKKAAAVLDFIHATEWNVRHTDPASHTRFTKFRGDFTSFEPTERYDLVYWDAFSPEKQAEMWTEELFASMYEHMETGGILVSYCAKGEIRRRLQRAGFGVERLQGPPGKREIIRAVKL